MHPSSPEYASQPHATDPKVTTALLQLALQLFHLRATTDVLDGHAIMLDDDAYLLVPNPMHKPGPFAVSVEFQDGVEIGAVFDLLGAPFGHPSLEQAVSLVARAKEDFDVVSAKAKSLIQDFVAEVAQAK